MSLYLVSSPHPLVSILKRLRKLKVKRYQQYCTKGEEKHVNIIVMLIAYFLSTLYLPKIVDSYSIFPEIGGSSDLIRLFDSASLKLNTHSIIDFIWISSIDVLHIMNKL